MSWAFSASQALVDVLRSPSGRELMVEISTLKSGGELGPAEVVALRKGREPELVTLALRICEANDKMGAKFPAEESLFFTPELLEQASSRPVALHRARRLSGLGTVLDLGCGAGGDLTSLAAVCDGACAVEADPLAAALARSNLSALGLSAEVREGIFPDVALPEHDVLFADPARRDTRRSGEIGGRAGRRVRPSEFSPEPAQLRQIIPNARSWVIKWGPALDLSHEALSVPDAVLAGFAKTDYELELVSWNGDLREALFWGGDARGGYSRRASVLRGPPGGAGLFEFRGRATDVTPPLSPPRAWLLEPDPALIRSALFNTFALEHGHGLLAPRIAYLTSDSPGDWPLTRSWPILETFPFSITNAQAALDRQRAGKLVIKKRGFPQDPERLRPRFNLTGDRDLTLFIYRDGEKRHTCLCEMEFSPPHDV